MELWKKSGRDSMVPGLKSFKESFSDFMDQYVIIGGAACDIYMESEDSFLGLLRIWILC